MAYKALYRTYRPDSFDQMAGQKHIVKTLENAIHNNQIAHAYLFCGPRGTGKTSSAKIFAKEINCESEGHKPCGKCPSCIAAENGTHPDIIEIDGASNNGVEEARNLIERVKYAPSLGKYKIYIIDEVHMITAAAFNALLKTIEEPPAHIIFILATTEPHKVLPTILSRCQRFDFSKITKNEIVRRLSYVAKQENISVEDNVLESIAILSDGGMRDALSILDQCRAYSPDKITLKNVNEIYGIVSIQEICDLLESVKQTDTKLVMNTIEQLEQSGSDIKRLTSDIIEIIKESVVYDYAKDDSLLSMLTLTQVRKLKENTSTTMRLAMIDILVETFEKYRNASNVVTYFEIALLKMMELFQNSDSKEAMNEPLPTLHLEEPKKVETIAEPIVEQKVEPVSEPVEEYGELEMEEDIVETIDMAATPIEETEIEPLEDLNTESMIVQEPTQEESIKEEAPVVEDSKPIVKEEKHLSMDLILRLLVGANKPEKQADNEKLRDLSEFALDLAYAKYAMLLQNCNIIASAQQYIVLCVESSAKANEINELDKNSEFLAFSERLLQKKKKVFALIPDERDEAIALFVKKNKENTLPDPMTFTFKEEEVKEEDDVALVKSLFGNVEIKED